MAVGILALQGAFAEHAAVLDRLGVPHFEIRQKRDLEQPMDRLILPGGESTVMRNAYGRQLGSFRTAQTFGKLGTLPMTFIRAPYIAAVHGDAQILASANGNIVAAQQDKQLVTAFHPELDESTAIHEYFLQIQ